MLRHVGLVLAILLAGALLPWALYWLDRRLFVARHGQAELDRFDAECARIDQELDGRRLVDQPAQQDGAA